MKQLLFVAVCLALAVASTAQTTYADSIVTYIQNYVNTHEVVKGEDRNALRFYDPDPAFRVAAKFERTQSGQWFEMPTSGRLKKSFRVYGVF